MMGVAVTTMHAILMPSEKGVMLYCCRSLVIIAWPVVWMMPRSTSCRGRFSKLRMKSMPLYHSFHRSTP